MLNNVRAATSTAKEKLKIAILKNPLLHCTFMHGKYEIKGRLISVSKQESNPTIRLLSHTGKERVVLVSNLVTIDGIDEL